jgi:hypothetical protein
MLQRTNSDGRQLGKPLGGNLRLATYQSPFVLRDYGSCGVGLPNRLRQTPFRQPWSCCHLTQCDFRVFKLRH